VLKQHMSVHRCLIHYIFTRNFLLWAEIQELIVVLSRLFFKWY
jgi:hypothetical protein